MVWLGPFLLQHLELSTDCGATFKQVPSFTPEYNKCCDLQNGFDGSLAVSASGELGYDQTNSPHLLVAAPRSLTSPFAVLQPLVASSMPHSLVPSTRAREWCFQPRREVPLTLCGRHLCQLQWKPTPHLVRWPQLLCFTRVGTHL